MRKSFYLLALLSVTSSCTPANIVHPKYDKNVKTAKVVIVRPDSIKFILIPSIFGFDGMDITQILNNGKTEIDIPIGNYEFFVRSDQADRPFKYSRKIQENEKVCLMIKANLLKSAMKLFYFSNAFTMEEVNYELCKPK